MGLRLHRVQSRQGLAWVRQGLLTWAKRPLAFAGMLATFLFAVLLLAMVLPVAGGILGLALLPMLSLGFMIATRSAMAGGPVHPLQLIEGLRLTDGPRRRAQLSLCAGYALGSVLVMLLASHVDGGTFEQLQRLMAEQQADKASKEIDLLLADPRLVQGMLVRLGLATLLSVPFWYAPALVHWGHQGALQALFSSALALWQTRGAFVLYAIGWAALLVGVGVLFTLLALVTGAKSLVGMLTMPLALLFSTAFYVSLWFSYRDSFEPGDDDGDAEADTAPSNGASDA